jgi:phage baseplate assembly protein V
MRGGLVTLSRKLALMVGRAVLRAVDDTKAWPAVQLELLAEELRADVEYAQDYGFTSHPHPGAEAIAVSVSGSRDHVVAIKVGDRRYRLKGLQQGEVALYTDEGDKVVLKRGGTIEVVASTKVRLVTPQVEMTGNLSVAGSVTVGGSVTAEGDVLGQGTSLHGHKHGGVSTGGAQTGVPV